MLKVGITGGIGSGKSTVCRVFQVLGVPVYDADSQAKHLMNSQPDLKAQIAHTFGQEAYQDDGMLNRTYLAQQVFPDAEKLNKLNALVHPAVGADFALWIQQQHTPYAIKEAALLVETGSYKNLDALIVVTAPENLRIARVVLRDSHRNREQVNDILKKQLPEAEKINKADYLINNDENHLILPQILDIHTKLTAKALNFS